MCPHKMQTIRNFTPRDTIPPYIFFYLFSNFIRPILCCLLFYYTYFNKVMSWHWINGCKVCYDCKLTFSKSYRKCNVRLHLIPLKFPCCFGDRWVMWFFFLVLTMGHSWIIQLCQLQKWPTLLDFLESWTANLIGKEEQSHIFLYYHQVFSATTVCRHLEGAL